MPPWKLKAVVQGALSLLPSPQRWNRLLQAHVTRSLRLTDARFLKKHAMALRHIAHAERRGGITGARVLEVGTGWSPIVPIGLALAGAASVVTVDRQDLLRRDAVLEALEHYRRLGAAERLALPAPAVTRVDALLRRAKTLDAAELLAALGVRTLTGDARATTLPAGSIDLVVSNNVLEHVPPRDLLETLRECRRLAAPGAVMSHFIDLADHYAGFDPSITVYNFLRYPAARWRLYNNALQYQNRLRASDLRRLHREAGWEVVDEEARREPPEVLRSVPLAPEFHGHAEEDLLAYELWLVSRVADA